MPGLFTTTSQAISASNPPRSVASTSMPSRVGAPGLSSTRTGTWPMAWSRRRLAPPSTPRPQTPTRPDASASADQEIGGGIAIGDAVGTAWLEQRVVRTGGWEGGLDLRPEAVDQRGAGPVVALGGQAERGPALFRVTHALERLGVRLQAQQGAETRRVG